MTHAPSRHSGIRRFLAGAMMAGGGMFALFCGIIVTVMSVQEPEWAWVVIFVGSFGIVPGAGVAIIGWSLWRK